MGETESSAEIAILAYTTEWCPDCMDAHKVLRRSGLPFTIVDVEVVPGAEAEMIKAADGVRKVPTIVIEGRSKRQVLIEPSAADLAAVLQQWKLTDSQSM